MSNKLKEIAQTKQGKVVRKHIKEWKQKVRDVSKDLPIDCDNELAVRKAMVKLIEKDLEQVLEPKKEQKQVKHTSYE